jgi:hypothetical protein
MSGNRGLMSACLNSGLRMDTGRGLKSAKSSCEQPQPINPLFDHLVGARERQSRNFEAGVTLLDVTWYCLTKATDYRDSDRTGSTSGVWQ